MLNAHKIWIIYLSCFVFQVEQAETLRHWGTCGGHFEVVEMKL